MNKKKSEQLGMPFGTATAKLRKRIIFRLVQRLQDDKCYQCGMTIDNVDELSIEHKTPWLGQPDLFWDLDNIAFSHLRCNVGAGNKNRRLDKDEKQRRHRESVTAWKAANPEQDRQHNRDWQYRRYRRDHPSVTPCLDGGIGRRAGLRSL